MPHRAGIVRSRIDGDIHAFFGCVKHLPGKTRTGGKS